MEDPERGVFGSSNLYHVISGLSANMSKNVATHVMVTELPTTPTPVSWIDLIPGGGDGECRRRRSQIN